MQILGIDSRFREEDTDKSFTDHLYHALNQKGINPFRDEDQNLASQNSSSNAIEESRFAIIVLLEKYADSTRLVDQLVKIVDLKNQLRLTVFPIFYHMDPAHLRRQSEECGKTFSQHEQDFQQNIEKVNEWKKALTEVANISGWDLRDREKFEKYDKIQLQQHLYQILSDIDECNWSDDIAIDLLRTRLKSKKVLITLDDVDQLEQLETLVGNWRRQHDCLGPRSRVIVTTTKNHLLPGYEEGNIYEVDKLTNNEALQLLHWKAFKDNCILDDYTELCSKRSSFNSSKFGIFLVWENNGWMVRHNS
ncbi:TMV resistance protein N-like [Ziziphus jujuba]|uniref:TMV resistance protein N-like n=1 Tax=Ziziphus jujuba TaxID=326968 RepID=A0ABM3ZXI1_ZIZJJ|nr:TMV resistance protein N-like [Ziziphus jujuba]